MLHDANPINSADGRLLPSSDPSLGVINEALHHLKAKEVATVPFWWHTIDVGHGVLTPGQTSPEGQDLRAGVIPRSLRGKSVLDVGCWDGYFSFWCERRGAIVMPIDDFQHKVFVKHKYGIALRGGEGFAVAARLLGSRLKLRPCSFLSADGSFDVVLYLGVLYHERHPLLALEHLARLTNETAVIETHYVKDSRDPVLHFYPGAYLNNDPTNYWGPSISCVELMLREVGFRSVSLAETYKDNDDRAVFVALK